MVMDAVGASLTLATLRVKSWEAEAPAVSVAVTRISRAPTSPLAGVPEKLLVAGLKESQAGRGLPSARVAERLRLSPASTSAKLLAGTVKAKLLSSLAPWSAMVMDAVGT